MVSEEARRARYTRQQNGPKTCTKCGIAKDRSEFAKSKDGKYGPILMSVCRSCKSIRALQWFYDNRERSLANQRARRMRKEYDLEVEEYEALLIRQDHRCAICGEKETTIRGGKLQTLSVDHCHDTGRIRGLLCNTCNRAIGLFKDNVDLLRRAANYLEGK